MVSELTSLDRLPVGLQTIDSDGLVTCYNQLAAELWGVKPEIGVAEWSGAWRLYWPDGRPMRHDENPTAISLKEGRSILGVEVVAERPDGTSVKFMPIPSPLKDSAGRTTGAMTLLFNLDEHRKSKDSSALLAAIVASSEDAIISKSLDGIITSWNAGAARIFGYQPEEMVGQSIRRIIPAELQRQEDEILLRSRNNEHIKHFDTFRIAKDGRRVNVDVSLSLIRDSKGVPISVSKIARDITERKRSEDIQRLLLAELNHRMKNMLATIQAIASQSLRAAANPSDFLASFNGRVQALARTNDVLVQGELRGASLSDLVHEQVALGSRNDARISYSGPEVTLNSRLILLLGLVLHELATNARKYGALSMPTGALSITWDVEMWANRKLRLVWRESGVPNVRTPQSHGFGTMLIQRSVQGSQGEAHIHYEAGGLLCEINLPLPEEDEHHWPTEIAVAS